MLLASFPLWSQTPAPEPDTLPNPIRQGDPALRALPPRMDYIEDLRRISPEELPQPVRETLQAHPEYNDWQNAMIYLDENMDEYVVKFGDAAETKSYRFNKEGKPILEK